MTEAAYVSSTRNMSLASATQSEGISRIQVWKCSYRWTIENFMHCPRRTREALESPPFTAGPHGELKWRLELYPRGISEDYSNYMAVYLKLLSSPRTTTHAVFEISQVDISGTPLKTFSREAFFLPFTRIGYEKFIKRSICLKQSSKCSTKDELLIHCEISSSSNISSSNDILSNAKFIMPVFHLRDQYINLLETGRLADVTIETDKEDFRAHSAVLAANSPKFLAMFGDREENENIRVNMKEFRHEVVAEMLRFMYGVKIPNFKGKMAEELLMASDWFGVGALKEVCEDFLVSKITVGNAANILNLADASNALRLKNYCLNFITENVAVVLDTAAWKEVVLEKPKIAEDLTSALAMHLMLPIP